MFQWVRFRDIQFFNRKWLYISGYCKGHVTSLQNQKKMTVLQFRTDFEHRIHRTHRHSLYNMASVCGQSAIFALILAIVCLPYTLSAENEVVRTLLLIRRIHDNFLFCVFK